MLLKNVFAKREPRTFTFHPFYYQKVEEDEAGPRIKFRRIRKGPVGQKKSVRGLVYLSILILAGLFYLFDLVRKEARTVDTEGIRIEQSPSGY